MTAPFVIEKDGRSERMYDIYSRLLEDRIVFIKGQITDDSADSVIAQLTYLASLSSDDDIHMYINSPGGSVSAGLAIYDIMQYVRCDVKTYCMGNAASMAAILLVGGAKRFILPHGRVLIHQPLIGGEMRGPTTDIEIESTEILRLRDELYQILSSRSGQPFDRIKKDCDRNKWLGATEALEYGIADEII